MRKNIFRVVGIQTDDTLFLGLDRFTDLEKEELQKARLTTKPRDELSRTNNLVFNGCILSQITDNTMLLSQKD